MPCHSKSLINWELDLLMTLKFQGFLPGRGIAPDGFVIAMAQNKARRFVGIQRSSNARGKHCQRARHRQITSFSVI
jgi:hypothetical protein